jgi:hypothetical protein
MKISNDKISKILGTNCGIYCIKNIVNNKVYIGSSKDIHKRISAHKMSLGKDSHHSLKLQRSYNKHRKDCFIFDILEICYNQDLETKEKEWITFFDSYKNGYNSTDEVGAPWRGKKQPINIKKLQKCKTVKMIDPSGNVVESYSIRDFCKKNNLNAGAISNVLNEKFFQFKGYRKYNSKLIGITFNKQEYYKILADKNIKCLEYQIVDPCGNVFSGKNLSKLCREFNLDKAAIHRVLKGKNSHHKGWTKSQK